MPTPQEMLPDVVKYFFEQALPQATGKTFAQLSDPAVHLGSYLKYEGAAVPTSLGQSLTPAYCLRVSPALAAAGGLPNLAGATVAGDGPLTHILWVRHVADAATDDEAEIRRVMADLDSFGQLFGPPSTDSGTGSGAAAGGSAGGPGAVPVADGTPGGAAAPVGGSPAGGATGAGATGAGASGGTGAGTAGGGGDTTTAAAALRAADWARAVVASRTALAVNLSSLTEIPAALRGLVEDLPALIHVLQHFFTYTDDGAYYRRWAAAGRDPSNPAHLTPEYKQQNVREVVLDRDRMYLYAIVPEALLAGGGDLGGGTFREVVIRFDETLDPARPYTIATVHTARWRRNAAPHEDFVFFYAEQGAGPPIPRAAKMKMAARLVEFLGGVAAAGDQHDAFLDRTNFVIKDNGAYFAQLIVRVEEGASLPDFVVTDTDHFDRAIQVPPDRIIDLALVPAVQHLTPLSSARLSLAKAKPMVHYDDLVAKIAAAKRGGKGVVVGIIDSGIDASHPAFAGRVHAFWDQGATPLVPGKTPKANSGDKDAYKMFNFGVELTGADAAKAQDDDGHGTHVAGIAAGAEVKDASGAVLMAAGLAPQATIVAVRAIGVGAPDDAQGMESWLSGAQWVFQKASELGMPCVINMSFGGHSDGHDGSDASSRDLYGRLTDSAGNYLPGRVVVAAAGNERDDGMHVRRTLRAPSGYQTMATLDIPAGYRRVDVHVWVKNPTMTCPVAFPLDLYLYRVASPPVVESTRLVRIGAQADTTNPAGTFPARRTQILVRSHASDIINGDHEYVVTLVRTTAQPMVASRWAIAMLNGDSHPLDVHMWMTWSVPDPTITPAPPAVRFLAATGPDDVAFLVGSPASSAAAISIASVNSQINWTSKAGAVGFTSPPTPPVGELSDFSSPGPLRDSSIPLASFYKHKVTHEINGVDCAAPGCMIQSALSAQAPTPRPELQVNARAHMLQGTSMASPVVTGLVANILAEEPTLTLPQVLDRLKNASSIPASSTFQPPAGTKGPHPLSRDWGYGLVNAGKLKP